MVKGLESGDVSENIQDVSSCSNSEYMETLSDRDWETQLDAATLCHFQSLSVSEIPEQISSTRCYGRGKGLADIGIPRLPKVYKEAQFTMPKSVDVWDENWQHTLQSKWSTNHRPLGGRGRGKMLQDASCRMDFLMENQRRRPAADEVSCDTASSKSTMPPFPKKSQKKTPLLFETHSDSDVEFCVSLAKDDNYNIASAEDFPTLLSQGPTTTDLNSKKAGSSRPVGKYFRKARNAMDRSPDENIHVGAFDDADEYSNLTPLDDADELSELTLDDVAKDIAGDVLQHGYKHTLLSHSNQMSSSSISERVFSESNSADDFVYTREKKTQLQSSNGNRLSAVDEVGITTRSAELPVPREADVDNIIEIDVKAMKQHTAGCFDEGNNGGDKKTESLFVRQTDASLQDNEVSASGSKNPAKTKKKTTAGWKLDGPLVVHLDNVPKNCGGELRSYLDTFGKVLDSEKKSKKGANAWRYRFESTDICDYVVECLHDNALFEGCSTSLQCYRLGDDPTEGTSV